MKSLFEVDEGCHGRGPVLAKWQKDGSFLASCGVNGLVEIFDRHGQQVDEVGLKTTNPVIGLDWDKDGEILAIIQEKVGAVSLYDLNKRKVSILEMSVKEPRCVAWSKTGPQLAVGASNGTLVLYRKDTLRQETVVGKHSGAIVCAIWSEHGNNRLALGSEDNTVSISSSEGATEDQFECRGRPVSVQFAPAKHVSNTESKTKQEKQWLIGVSTKAETFAVFTFGENPIEMQFQSRYGKLVSFGWLSNAEVVIGFTSGQVIAISTQEPEFGQEVYSERLHRTSLTDLVISRALKKVATCGDSTVRVIDSLTWKEIKGESISLENEEGQLDRMHWTLDGQILSVSTKGGRLFNYLTKMPMVNSGYGQNIAYLSSLREISVVNALDMQRGIRVSPIRVPVQIEPSFVALGADHLAIGMNNRAWIYRFQGNEDPNKTDVLVREEEFLASVDRLLLNETCFAALCSGQVYLHRTERVPDEEDVSRVFPDPGGAEISCIALTTNFLIYGTVEGTVEFFSLQDGSTIAGSELRHECGIKQIFTNNAGTRIVIIDVTGSGFLFNPIDGQLLPIPDLSAETKNVLWDGLDPFIFFTSDPHEISTYVYSPLTINGPTITKVGPLEVLENGDMVTEPLSTQLPPGFETILAFGGIVTCQTPSSQLSKVMIGSHEALHSQERTQDASRAKFHQSLALRKLQDAWNMALVIESRPCWLALSGQAMEELNVEMAIRVWRKLGDAGMVMALEKIRFVEDKYLLAGHIAALFGDYAQAQELFLLSPSPQAALEMRKDLLHWEQALKLAETIAPQQLAEISANYAQQLEFRGEYRSSLDMYQSALEGLSKSVKQGRSPVEEKNPVEDDEALDPTASEDDHHVESRAENKLSLLKSQCLAGIAKMTLRVGNIPKGVALALDTKDKNLCKECADILVSAKQFADAATLYEQAEEFEEAASIYIKAKNYLAAQPLLAKVTAPKLHLQFAKAKEAEKDYRTAVAEYEKGKDLDSVVRVSLEHLRQPEKAFAIVRKHQSPQGAEMAARYCQSVNDFRGAIEFLLMAKRSTDAFELATAHDTMEVFESALGAEGTPEEYNNIAKYYETKQQYSKAAEFYAICGQFHKALKLYLQSNEIEKAIDVVGKARSDMLTHTLIDFLMGESTGVVQDPVHIFRLYMALGNYPQAARTAMVIAHQERENGNYRSAHSTLYETHRELESRGIRVPQTLRTAFLLLHSYLLVKKRIKVDDHTGAARLLSRVARNISKFPSHTVPILTSTVIECQRGGLKKTAFEYATQLMRPENRSGLDPNYRRKIEAIVRRRGGTELDDASEERSECPYTGEMIPSYELVCPRTKNHIPFCIVTGKHMVADDWCFCPNSKMPALYSEYVNYLQSVKTEEEKVDPICGKPVRIEDLRKEEDPKPYLDAYSAPLEEDENEEEDGAPPTLPARPA